MQSDALFPFLTVRETFQYAAYFRVHNKSTEEKNAIADATIKSLRLESCADTIIGDENVRGLSGGEKRRVSIGVDIVNEPKVRHPVLIYPFTAFKPEIYNVGHIP